MKLNIFFIVMYLFTMFAYPFVFVHGKLHQSLKARNTLSIELLLLGK